MAFRGCVAAGSVAMAALADSPVARISREESTRVKYVFVASKAQQGKAASLQKALLRHGRRHA